MSGSLLSRLLVQQVPRTIDRGVLISVGFVREDGRLKLLFEVSKWNEALAQELRDAYNSIAEIDWPDGDSEK